MGLVPTSTRKHQFNEALKMETVCFSETLLSTYMFTWRYNLEDQHKQ
jgi:hypothetical protein